MTLTVVGHFKYGSNGFYLSKLAVLGQKKQDQILHR